jgi:hypothetical protein
MCDRHCDALLRTAVDVCIEVAGLLTITATIFTATAAVQPLHHAGCKQIKAAVLQTDDMSAGRRL